MKKNKFYITTPIYYPSGKFHIGTAYTTTLANTIKKYRQLKGFDTYMLTGLDEHGQKIQEVAISKGKTPQEYVDEMADMAKELWTEMKIEYDDFIRTTEERHTKVVKKIFEKFMENGDIYKGEYEGWYCTPCESFWTDKELVDGKCPDCGREVVKKSEEAYFFKMSKYQDRLYKYILDNPNFIKPESRKNEMINNFIKPGLQDLCVSRTTFDWGIRVPFNDKHIIYVWIDALSNYITNIGYISDEEEFLKWWPADLHLVGKDIIRFHTIYWPIILMALDLPLPKQVFGHPWLLMNNDKMSKSKGNIMYADDLVKLFGVDAVRFYLLKEIPYENDGTIGYDLLIDSYNTNLANILGNLLNRTISMSKKYFNKKISYNKSDKLSDELIEKVNKLDDNISGFMDTLQVGKAIDSIFDILKAANKYIDDTTPWILAKEERYDDLETVLYTLLETLRVCALFIKPFLPDTGSEMLEQLNINDDTNSFNINNHYYVNEPHPLFIRIDKEKKLQEIANINVN